MKILIIGFGSIARRHISNINQLQPNASIAVWEQYEKTVSLDGFENQIETIFFTKDEALSWSPDVVFVANPAPFHNEAALLFLRNKAHVFIEKPLSDTDNGVEELLRESENTDRIVMVGYVLRFLEPLKIIKKALEKNSIGRILSITSSSGQHLLSWRPQQRYQDTVTARKDLGGGVLLELSHELDYMRWFIGEITEVKALCDRVSSLEIDVEDVAEISLRFESGAVGHVHLDMLDHASHRMCRIIGESGTIVWNITGDNRVQKYEAANGTWKDLFTACKLDRNEIYLEELKHFFECIAKNIVPKISGYDGRQIVKVVQAARQSSKTGKSIIL